MPLNDLFNKKKEDKKRKIAQAIAARKGFNFSGGINIPQGITNPGAGASSADVMQPKPAIGMGAAAATRVQPYQDARDRIAGTAAPRVPGMNEPSNYRPRPEEMAPDGQIVDPRRTQIAQMIAASLAGKQPFAAGAPRPEGGSETLAGIMYDWDSKNPNASPEDREKVKYTLQRRLQEQNDWKGIGEELTGGVYRGIGAFRRGSADEEGLTRMEKEHRGGIDRGLALTGGLHKEDYENIGLGTDPMNLPENADAKRSYEDVMNPVYKDKSRGDVRNALSEMSSKAFALSKARHFGDLLSKVIQMSSGKNDPLSQSISSPVGQIAGAGVDLAATFKDPTALLGLLTGATDMAEGIKKEGLQSLVQPGRENAALFEQASALNPLAAKAIGKVRGRKPKAPTAREPLALPGRTPDAPEAAKVVEAKPAEVEATAAAVAPEVVTATAPKKRGPKPKPKPEVAPEPEVTQKAEEPTTPLTESKTAFVPVGKQRVYYKTKSGAIVIATRNGKGSAAPVVITGKDVKTEMSEQRFVEAQRQGLFVHQRRTPTKKAETTEPTETKVEAPVEAAPKAPVVAQPTDSLEGKYTAPKSGLSYEVSLDKDGNTPTSNGTGPVYAVKASNGTVTYKYESTLSGPMKTWAKEGDAAKPAEEAKTPEAEPSTPAPKKKASPEQMSAYKEWKKLGEQIEEADRVGRLGEVPPVSAVKLRAERQKVEEKLKSLGVKMSVIAAGTIGLNELAGEDDDTDKADTGLGGAATPVLVAVLAGKLKKSGFNPKAISKVISEAVRETAARDKRLPALKASLPEPAGPDSQRAKDPTVDRIERDIAAALQGVTVKDISDRLAEQMKDSGASRDAIARMRDKVAGMGDAIKEALWRESNEGTSLGDRAAISGGDKSYREYTKGLVPNASPIAKIAEEHGSETKNARQEAPKIGKISSADVVESAINRLERLEDGGATLQDADAISKMISKPMHMRVFHLAGRTAARMNGRQKSRNPKDLLASAKRGHGSGDKSAYRFVHEWEQVRSLLVQMAQRPEDFGTTDEVVRPLITSQSFRRILTSRFGLTPNDVYSMELDGNRVNVPQERITHEEYVNNLKEGKLPPRGLEDPELAEAALGSLKDAWMAYHGKYRRNNGWANYTPVHIKEGIAGKSEYVHPEDLRKMARDAFLSKSLDNIAAAHYALMKQTGEVGKGVGAGAKKAKPDVVRYAVDSLLSATKTGEQRFDDSPQGVGEAKLIMLRMGMDDKAVARLAERAVAGQLSRLEMNEIDAAWAKYEKGAESRMRRAAKAGSEDWADQEEIQASSKTKTSTLAGVRKLSNVHRVPPAGLPVNTRRSDGPRVLAELMGDSTNADPSFMKKRNAKAEKQSEASGEEVSPSDVAINEPAKRTSLASKVKLLEMHRKLGLGGEGKSLRTAIDEGLFSKESAEKIEVLYKTGAINSVDAAFYMAARHHHQKFPGLLAKVSTNPKMKHLWPKISDHIGEYHTKFHEKVKAMPVEGGGTARFGPKKKVDSNTAARLAVAGAAIALGSTQASAEGEGDRDYGGLSSLVSTALVGAGIFAGLASHMKGGGTLKEKTSVAGKFRAATRMALGGALGNTAAAFFDQDRDDEEASLRAALGMGVVMGLTSSHLTGVLGDRSAKQIRWWGKDGSLTSGYKALKQSQPIRAGASPVIPASMSLRRFFAGNKDFPKRVEAAGIRQNRESSKIANTIDRLIKFQGSQISEADMSKARGSSSTSDGYRDTLMYRRSKGLPPRNAFETEAYRALENIYKHLGKSYWGAGGGVPRVSGEVSNSFLAGARARFNDSGTVVEGVVQKVYADGTVRLGLDDGTWVRIPKGKTFVSESIVNPKTFVPRSYHPEWRRTMSLIADKFSDTKGDVDWAKVMDIASGKVQHQDISQGLAHSFMQAIDHGMNVMKGMDRAAIFKLYNEGLGRAGSWDENWLDSAMNHNRTARDLEGPDWIYDWTMDGIIDHVNEVTAASEMLREFGPHLQDFNEAVAKIDRAYHPHIQDAIKVIMGMDIMPREWETGRKIISGINDGITLMKLGLNLFTTVRQFGAAAMGMSSVGAFSMGVGSVKFAGRVVQGMFGSGIDMVEMLKDPEARKMAAVYAALGHGDRGSKAFKDLKDSGQYGHQVSQTFASSKLAKSAGAKVLMAAISGTDSLVRGSTMFAAEHAAKKAIESLGEKRFGITDEETHYFLSEQLGLTDAEIADIKSTPVADRWNKFGEEISSKAFKFGSDLNGNPERGNMPTAWHSTPYVQLVTKLQTFNYVTTWQYGNHMKKILKLSTSGSRPAQLAAARELVKFMAYTAGVGALVNEGIEEIAENILVMAKKEPGKFQGWIKEIAIAASSAGTMGLFAIPLEMSGLAPENQDSIRGIMMPVASQAAMSAATALKNQNALKFANEMIGKGSAARTLPNVDAKLRAAAKKRDKRSDAGKNKASTKDVFDSIWKGKGSNPYSGPNQ